MRNKATDELKKYENYKMIKGDADYPEYLLRLETLFEQHAKKWYFNHGK